MRQSSARVPLKCPLGTLSLPRDPEPGCAATDSLAGDVQRKGRFNRINQNGEYRLMVLRPGMSAAVDIGGSWSGLQPAISPDGRQLAFSSQRDDPYGDIYVGALQGQELIDVRRLTQDGGTELTPSWSPDGQHIAFTSYRTGYPSIWIMSATGQNPTQLTSGGDTWSDYFPAWSPAGDRLAFQRIGVEESRIGWVPRSGGAPAFFTLAGRHFSPSWSPDGAYIAIASDDGDIRILTSDGVLVRRIVRPGTDRSPSWIRRDAHWP